MQTTTGTLTSSNGIATLTLGTGETYTTKDTNGFIKRLDTKMTKDGWRRGGYDAQDGAMVATIKRSAVASKYLGE